jgi:hypothetical protein
VLAVGFTAQLLFLQMPTAADDAALADARALQLDDLSLTAHFLAANNVRSGQAFVAAGGDPGYRVVGFSVGSAALTQLPSRTALTATLSCTGAAEIWPPGSVSSEGTILRVERTPEVLPMRIDLDRPSVRVGESTTVRLRSPGGRRLINPTTGQTSPLQLAVIVASDLPTAQRGTIQSGAAGAEQGVRVVATAADETVVTYRAPTANPGAVRTEYVAFHLATPDLHAGVFLGSVAINLLPAAP